MINEYIKIEVGQLYIVDKSFWTTGEGSHGRKTKSKFVKGDIIEIRYPYEWHFRDEQNNYHHAKTKTLIQKCSLYGVIHDNVRSNNKNKLKEILEEKLYHELTEFELKLK